jgi:hypothetical protein
MAKEKEKVEWKGETIPKERWGCDHNSTLLYIETRAVDHGGRLDVRHLRRDVAYPTRLEDVILVGHTDMNCIDDFEAAGLVSNVGTGINPVCRLTAEGWEAAWFLRRARADRIRTS